MAIPYSRVTVTAGSLTWTRSSTDPAAGPRPGPVAPLSFGWTIPDQSLGFPAQPDPTTAAVGILAETPADVAGIDIGTPLHVAVYLTADPGPPWAEFAGRVADIEAHPAPGHGTIYRLLGVDYTVDLTAKVVGAGAWPAETGQARSDRVLAEAGVVTPTPLKPQPGGNFGAREASPATARDVLTETLAHGVTLDGGRYLVAGSVTAGVQDPTPYKFRWVDRAVAGIDVLDPHHVDVVASWRRTKRSAADWVTITHPGGPTIYGTTTGVAHPPVSSPLTNPADLAAFLLDNVAGYQWEAGTLRVHVHAMTNKTPVARWFDHPTADVFPGVGRAVVVDPVPAASAPGGLTRFSGMLAAARLTIPEDGRFYVDFKLRADVPNDSFENVRWDTIDQTMTWETISQTVTWHDYAAGESAGGAGTLTWRWSDFPDPTTWNTIHPTLTWYDYRTIQHP